MEGHFTPPSNTGFIEILLSFQPLSRATVVIEISRLTKASKTVAGPRRQAAGAFTIILLLGSR